jgi:hypothetical protein
MLLNNEDTMQLLTRDEFKKLTKSYFYDIDFEIISDNIKILSDIFDERNQKICPECPQNFHYTNPKYKYKIVDGKRKRETLPVEKEKFSETGCCYGCKSNKGHYRFPDHNTPMHVYDQCQNIFKQFYFNEKTGFFNLDLKTCSIPRELRSDICLRHTCHTLNLTEEEKRQVQKSSTIILAIKKMNQLPW